jgi:hypothetical protein
LNAGQPSLGFSQRLAHMKRFFKEHISRVGCCLGGLATQVPA